MTSLKYRKKYYDTHKEQYSQYSRRYYLKNREDIIKRIKENRKKNKNIKKPKLKNFEKIN